jgi:hypothetical protein
MQPDSLILVDTHLAVAIGVDDDHERGLAEADARATRQALDERRRARLSVTGPGALPIHDEGEGGYPLDPDTLDDLRHRRARKEAAKVGATAVFCVEKDEDPLDPEGTAEEQPPDL